jgi:hypothetical protein
MIYIQLSTFFYSSRYTRGITIDIHCYHVTCARNALQKLLTNQFILYA